MNTLEKRRPEISNNVFFLLFFKQNGPRDERGPPEVSQQSSFEKSFVLLFPDFPTSLKLRALKKSLQALVRKKPSQLKNAKRAGNDSAVGEKHPESTETA